MAAWDETTTTAASPSTTGTRQGTPASVSNPNPVPVAQGAKAAWDDDQGPAQPTAVQGSGMLSKVGGAIESGAKAAGNFALGMVPVVGPAVEAERHGLNPTQQGALGQVAGLIEHPPMHVMQATPHTREWYEAQSRNWQMRTEALEQKVNNSPMGRAAAAGLIDVPPQAIMFGLWGLGERAVATGVMHATAVQAENAAQHGSLEEVQAVALRLAARKELARRAALTVPNVALGEAELARRRLEDGEKVPLSAYLTTAVAGTAFGLALGQVSSRAGEQAVNEAMVKVPYLARQVQGAQALAKQISTAEHIPAQQAGAAIYRLLRDEGTEADRALVGKYVSATDQSDLGKLLHERSKAPAAWNVDHDARPEDPVVVTLETPRGTEIKALKTNADMVETSKAVERGEARVQRAIGPAQRLRSLRSRVPIVDRAKLSVAEIESHVNDRLATKFPKRVLQLEYQPGLPRYTGEAPGYAQRRFDIENRQRPTTGPQLGGPLTPRTKPHTPGMVDTDGMHPAEAYAKLADAIVDGEGGLKDEGFVPVQSGTAVASHAHPWMDAKAEGTNEVPVIVPQTQEKVLATPSLTTDPKAASAEPTGDTYESHKVKLAPDTQVEQLAEQNPTPLPAETAFPLAPDFVEKLDKAAQGTDLDKWIDSRTKAGKGEQGKAWWNTLVGQVFHMSPHDPRLTPEAAKAVMVIQREHLVDLERAAKRGKISYDDPEAIQKLQTFHRWKDAWTQMEDIGGGPGLVVRESALDSDGTIMSVNPRGDGTETVSKGRVAGTAIRRKVTELSKPQGDVPVWDFTGAVVAAHHDTGFEPSYETLQAKAVAAEEVRKAVGTPIQEATPPREDVIPPEEAERRNAPDTEPPAPRDEKAIARARQELRAAQDKMRGALTEEKAQAAHALIQEKKAQLKQLLSPTHKAETGFEEVRRRQDAAMEAEDRAAREAYEAGRTKEVAGKLDLTIDTVGRRSIAEETPEELEARKHVEFRDMVKRGSFIQDMEKPDLDPYIFATRYRDMPIDEKTMIYVRQVLQHHPEAAPKVEEWLKETKKYGTEQAASRRRVNEKRAALYEKLGPRKADVGPQGGPPAEPPPVKLARSKVDKLEQALIKADESGDMDKFDEVNGKLQSAREALKRLLTGFSKGSVRRTEWEPLPSDHLLSEFARDMGHGVVEKHPNGVVRVRVRMGSKFLTMKYGSEDEAAAGIAHLANRVAAASRVDAAIERAIHTNQLPPVAVPSGAADPLIRAMHTLGYEAYGTDKPLTWYERWAHKDFTGLLHDTEAKLGGMDEKLGRFGVFLAHQYRTVLAQLNAESDAAVSQFHRLTQGRATVRGIEAGIDKAMADAWAQTGAKLGDARYKQSDQLGAPLGARVKGTWVPHWFDLTQALKRSGGKLVQGFVNDLVRDGLGSDHNQAWQTFIALSDMQTHEAELERATDVMNRNRKLRDQPPLSKTEVEQKLAKFSRRRATIAPHIQFDREGHQGYSDNIYAAARHSFNAMNRSIADRLVFGKDMERLNGLIDGLRDKVGGDEANEARMFFDAMRGRPYSGVGGSNRLLNGLLVADRTYLSEAFLRHLPQNFFTMQQGGLGKFLHGLRATVRDYSSREGRETAMQFGAIHSRVRERYYEGGVDQLTERRPSIPERVGDFMSGTLEHTVNFSRTIAMHVGHQMFDDYMEHLDDPKALKGLNELLHRNAPATAYMMLDDASRDALRVQAGISAADRNLFRFDALSAPPSYHQHPMFRLFTQFHNYLYNYTRLVAHELAGRDVPWQRRARMILTMGLLQPIYSYGHMKILNAIGSTTRETKALGKTIDQLCRDPKFSNWLWLEVAAWSEQHSWGLFQGLFDAIWTQNTQALDELYSGVPSVNWIGTGMMAGINTVVAAANYVEGKKALARYQLRKAGQQGAMVIGGSLAKGLATKAMGGEPRKPSTRSSQWGKF